MMGLRPLLGVLLGTASLLGFSLAFGGTALSAPNTQLGAASAAGARYARSVRTAAPLAPEAVREAKRVYANVCANCHGDSGRGDAPGVAALNPKARDFTDSAWQRATSDEAITRVIVEGGPAIGKSPLMPPSARLRKKPEVVAALRVLIRDLGNSAR